MNRELAMFLFMAALVAITAAQESEDNNATEVTSMEDTSEERKKKDMMTQMYMAVMMLKGFVGMALSTFDTFIGVKSFGLSVVGTIINIGRFLLQLKQYKDKQGAELSSGIGGGDAWGGIVGGGHERISIAATQAPWRPPPNYYYTYSS